MRPGLACGPASFWERLEVPTRLFRRDPNVAEARVDPARLFPALESASAEPQPSRNNF